MPAVESSEEDDVPLSKWANVLKQHRRSGASAGAFSHGVTDAERSGAQALVSLTNLLCRPPAPQPRRYEQSQREVVRPMARGQRAGVRMEGEGD